MKTSKPFVEVRGPVSSTNRKPTTDELAVAKATRVKLKALLKEQAKIDKQIESLKSKCTHTVSVDEASFIYDFRSCYACGHDQGMV